MLTFDLITITVFFFIYSETQMFAHFNKSISIILLTKCKGRRGGL